MALTFESVSKVITLCVIENAIELSANEVWIVEVFINHAIFQTKLRTDNWKDKPKHKQLKEQQNVKIQSEWMKPMIK